MREVSTKIYAGYRLAAGVDVFEFCDRLRATLDPVRDKVDAAWLMQRAVAAADSAATSGTPMPPALADAYGTWVQTQQEADESGYTRAQQSHRFDPHRFEVAFGRTKPTPSTDPACDPACDPGCDPVAFEPRILARVYCEEPTMIAAWEALPEVERYGYWDNSDPEPGCTATEWEDRRQAWLSVTPQYGAPALSTLMFTLRNRGSFDTSMETIVMPKTDADAEQARRARLVAAVPDRTSRVAAQVQRLVVRAAVHQALEAQRVEHTAGPADDRADTRASSGAAGPAGLTRQEVAKLLRTYANLPSTAKDLPEHDELVAAVEAALDIQVAERLVEDADTHALYTALLNIGKEPAPGSAVSPGIEGPRTRAELAAAAFLRTAGTATAR